ncbi:MAG: RNA polymerase sigma factor [Clostridia bacterium]|nr:RNA polymerase sigma factor [Clostridia bacterium]
MNAYQKYLDGDDSALAELLGEYRSPLIFYINRFVCTAEELADDTFFKLIVKKPPDRDESHFKTWLFTVGRNMALDHLRKARRMTELSAEPEDTVSLEEEMIKSEEAKALHEALGRLKAEYRDVLHLTYFEEMSNEEAAAVMKKSKRQIEMLVYRAKAALKRELEKEDL